MSLDGFAWVGPGLGEARCGDGYAIGETAQQTTRIKLTSQPYREEIGVWRPVQFRGFGCATPFHAATTSGCRGAGSAVRAMPLAKSRIRFGGLA